MVAVSSPSQDAGAPARRRAVFTDRDGTLNPDFHYLSEPDRYEFLPGVVEGIRLLREHGFLVICVTNQSGVGRGYFTRERLEEIHARIRDRLKPHGTEIDAFYYCPHRPEDGCRCRKPSTELFERAVAEWGIDLGVRRSSAIATLTCRWASASGS